jgi:hypothetical protein
MNIIPLFWWSIISFASKIEIRVKTSFFDWSNEINQHYHYKSDNFIFISCSPIVSRSSRQSQWRNNDELLIQNSKTNPRFVWVVKTVIDEKVKCFISMWWSWWMIWVKSINGPGQFPRFICNNYRFAWSTESGNWFDNFNLKFLNAPIKVFTIWMKSNADRLIQIIIFGLPNKYPSIDSIAHFHHLQP